MSIEPRLKVTVANHASETLIKEALK